MLLRYPRSWAETNGWTSKRLTLEEAIQFVEAVQNLQFGELLQIQAEKEEFPGDGLDETRKQTEQKLQNDLQRVLDWLEQNQPTQQTISKQKVITKIETETDCQFEFSE